MNDICVCEDWYQDDGPEFVQVKIVKARKSHVCCECVEKIEIKKQYEKVSGKWDGEFSTFKTCLPCSNIRKDYFKCGWIYGEMWSMIIEQLYQVYWEYEESGEIIDTINSMVPNHYKIPKEK